MPNDLDNFSLYVVVAGSGSLMFDSDGATLQPAGGSFTAPFSYMIGTPASTTFQVEIDDAAATVSVSPAAPVTQRQQMGGSQSEMEDVPPDEVQNGRVSGSVPVNASTSPVTHTVRLTMVQP